LQKEIKLATFLFLVANLKLKILLNFNFMMMIFFEFFTLRFLILNDTKEHYNSKRQNLIFCFIMVSCFPEIRFDPILPDRGDFAIPHAIVSANKLFYTIHYDIFSNISMTK
jgi:hypothetical protein